MVIGLSSILSVVSAVVRYVGGQSSCCPSGFPVPCLLGWFCHVVFLLWSCLSLPRGCVFHVCNLTRRFLRTHFVATVWCCICSISHSLGLSPLRIAGGSRLFCLSWQRWILWWVYRAGSAPCFAARIDRLFRVRRGAQRMQ